MYRHLNNLLEQTTYDNYSKCKNVNKNPINLSDSPELSLKF